MYNWAQTGGFLHYGIQIGKFIELFMCYRFIEIGSEHCFEFLEQTSFNARMFAEIIDEVTE